MLRGRVAILFLEVARRSPWCRGTPAHVHWSLLTAATIAATGFSPLRFVSLKRRGERRRTPLPRSTRVLLFHPPTRRTPHLESTTSPPRGSRLPSLLYPPHPLVVVAAATATAATAAVVANAPPPLRSFLSLAGHCRHSHYHRLLLQLSSTSNSDDPTHPTVARYYHSVLLAIYRPLSTTLPPNGVYRCCLAA